MADYNYIYTYHYTVTTRVTPASRWAVMRAILMFHNCEGQSHKTVSTDHNFTYIYYDDELMLNVLRCQLTY